jgi:hypothetical protein
MAKTAGVLTQGQVTAYLKSAKRAGYANATVEATMPNGTKLKITAHADEPVMTKQSNGKATEEVEDWLAKHAG